MLKRLTKPDVTAAFGASPVVDRVLLGPGASMSANVTVSGGGGGSGGRLDGGLLARALDRLAPDASVADLMAARRTALTA